MVARQALCQVVRKTLPEQRQRGSVCAVGAAGSCFLSRHSLDFQIAV